MSSTRRDVVRALGCIGTAALAGCAIPGGGGGEDGEGGGGEDGDGGGGEGDGGEDGMGGGEEG